jgi:hypothetical protein
MYADEVTDSMKQAIGETQRRRKIQIAYNREHDIDPQSIRKKVSDILLTMAVDSRSTVPEKRRRKREHPEMPTEELQRLIQQLEEEMHEAAKDLRFEYAARLRDEVRDLRGPGPRGAVVGGGPASSASVPVAWFGAGGLVHHATVLCEGGRVTYAGPSAPAPPADELLEVDGFLMPGVVDRHVHIRLADPGAVLFGGVTAVRDLGWVPEEIFALANASELPSFTGPVIRACRC